jgi:hypothetical protein
MSRNVQNTEAPHDLVSGLGSSHIGTVGKLADRLNKRVAIATGLPRAEILSRSFENICEIELCRSAEPNTPFPLGHDALLSFARNDFLGKFVQISLQQCGGADLLTSRKVLSASAWLWFHLLICGRVCPRKLHHRPALANTAFTIIRDSASGHEPQRVDNGVGKSDKVGHKGVRRRFGCADER